MTQSRQPATDAAIANGRFRSYLFGIAAILCLMAAGITGFFAATQHDRFLYYAAPTYQEIITRSKRNILAGQNADIVIVGDSTGLVGVVPRVLKQTTALSAFNLSMTLGSFAAAGTDAVDDYLLLNSAPGFILLYLNPWTTPSRPGDMINKSDGFTSVVPSYEATFAVATMGTTGQLLRYLLEYPDEAVAFVRVTGNRIAFNRRGGSQRRQRLAEAVKDGDGWLSFERDLAEMPTFPGLQADCSFETRDVVADRDYIEMFRRRYTTPRTRVLVLLAPVPACDLSFPNIVVAYAGLLDKPPMMLASDNFANDAPRRSHLLEAGALLNSQKLGEFIKSIKTPD